MMTYSETDLNAPFVIKGRHKYAVYDKHINNLMKNYTIH